MELVRSVIIAELALSCLKALFVITKCTIFGTKNMTTILVFISMFTDQCTVSLNQSRAGSLWTWSSDLVNNWCWFNIFIHLYEYDIYIIPLHCQVSISRYTVRGLLVSDSRSSLSRDTQQLTHTSIPQYLTTPHHNIISNWLSENYNLG